MDDIGSGAGRGGSGHELRGTMNSDKVIKQGLVLGDPRNANCKLFIKS